ncbi:MAG: hypothetical protein IKJ03_01685 [Mycoplasmataceae bacterium]|nr:hypothetical protein [Mycoplasmataceae bacterium]
MKKPIKKISWEEFQVMCSLFYTIEKAGKAEALTYDGTITLDINGKQYKVNVRNILHTIGMPHFIWKELIIYLNTFIKKEINNDK